MNPIVLAGVEEPALVARLAFPVDSAEAALPGIVISLEQEDIVQFDMILLIIESKEIKPSPMGNEYFSLRN